MLEEGLIVLEVIAVVEGKVEVKLGAPSALPATLVPAPPLIPLPAGTLYAITEPEYVGEMPVRIELFSVPYRLPG